MDIMDQLDEAKYCEKPGTEKERAGLRVEFTYVYQIRGRWYEGTFAGSFSDCTDHIEGQIKAKKCDPDKARWTRAHVVDGQIKVHPKRDSLTEAKVLEVMKRKDAAAAKKRAASKR